MNDYEVKSEKFQKTFLPVTQDNVRTLSCVKVPEVWIQFNKSSKVISRHTLYKVKQNDDGSLTLKATISSHGNEDDMKNKLRKDCKTCPMTGLRIFEWIASLLIYKNHWADVKAATLQELRSREMSTCLPRSKVEWSTVIYCYHSQLLMNWSTQTRNGTNSQIGHAWYRASAFSTCTSAFRSKRKGNFSSHSCENCWWFKVAVEDNCVQHFHRNVWQEIQARWCQAWGRKTCFLGVNTVQISDCNIKKYADDKLEYVFEYPFSTQRRKQVDQLLHQI